MNNAVAFLALPVLIAVAGSVLMWTLARARRRRNADSHGHLRAFRYRGGDTPIPQPSGIVPHEPDEE